RTLGENSSAFCLRLAVFAAMQESAFGTKRTCQSVSAMSAIGGKADIRVEGALASFVRLRATEFGRGKCGDHGLAHRACPRFTVETVIARGVLLATSLTGWTRSNNLTLTHRASRSVVMRYCTLRFLRPVQKERAAAREAVAHFSTAPPLLAQSLKPPRL